MQSEPYNIDIFYHAEIDDVSGIFANELPEDFCSLLGPGFLRKFFLPYFLNTDSHIGYVARKGDHVIGFAMAARAEGYYRGFIKKNYMSLTKYSLMACINDIRRLGYFLDVCRVMYGNDAFRPKENDLELLYLCVDSTHKGTGIGSRLVEEVLQKGKELGYGRCVLKTFPFDFIKRFYSKCGFEPVHFNQGRIWYSKDLLIPRTSE